MSRFSVSFDRCSNSAVLSLACWKHFFIRPDSCSCRWEPPLPVLCQSLHSCLWDAVCKQASFSKQAVGTVKWAPVCHWDFSQPLLALTAAPLPAPSISCWRLGAKGAEMQPWTGLVQVASTSILSHPFWLLVLSPFQSKSSSWWEVWEERGPANVSSEGMHC